MIKTDKFNFLTKRRILIRALMLFAGFFGPCGPAREWRRMVVRD